MPAPDLKLASDEPYAYVGDDLLGRTDQVENLAHFIKTTPTPFTFAVYGQWGSGKTRFLKDVQAKLKAESTPEQSITTVWFNLWEHQGDADAAVAMIQCAMQELDPHWQKDRHLRQVLGQLISATSVGSNFSVEQSSLKAGVTVSASNWKEASKAVKEKEMEVLDRQEEMKKKFKQVLDELVDSQDPGKKWFWIPMSIVIALLTWMLCGVIHIFGQSIVKGATWLWDKVNPSLGWGILVPLVLLLVGCLVFEARYRRHRDRTDREFTQNELSARRNSRWRLWLTGRKTTADKKKVIFFIDDLDRCLPKQALALLERIKLFLSVEENACAFVLGLDPDAIEDIVSSKYAQSESKNQAELDEVSVMDGRQQGDIFAEYLEKIIQFSVRLPMPTEENLREYVESIIHNNIPSAIVDLADHEIPPGIHSDIDIDTANAIVWDLAEAAEECEASLRRTKRLVNAFTYYHRLALSGGESHIDDYDVEVMAVVVSLQILYPDQWDIIHHQNGYELLTALFNTDFVETASNQVDHDELDGPDLSMGILPVGEALSPQSAFAPPPNLVSIARRCGWRVNGILGKNRNNTQYFEYYNRYRTLVGRSNPDYAEDDAKIRSQTMSVPVVADVGVATLVDRVEWQLVRLRWPVGAGFLQVEVTRTVSRYDGQREIIQKKIVSRKEFDRVGGVLLTNLHGTPATVTVWGVCPNGIQSDQTQNYMGTPAVLNYPGHRLLRYMVRTNDGFRKSEYQLLVEREGEWPDYETLMLAGGSKCPLAMTDDNLVPDLVRIGVVNIERDSLQERVLTPVTMTPLADTDRRPAYLRLLSKPTQVAKERPMLAWKVPPEVKAEPPVQSAHGSVCPECFTELPPNQRLFVCTGVCPEVDDNQRVARLRQGGAKIRRLTIADAKIGPKGQILEPPPFSVACAGCGRTTSQVICPACHAKLPLAWSDTDLLTVSIAGTKGSGKSVFVWSLLPYLRDNLIKRLGGGMQPTANSEFARAKMEEISRVTQTWTYPDATPWLTQNPVLRLPLLFNVGSILNSPPGHLRAMSFFDTSGEMLEDPTGVMFATDILSHSDLVVLMVDMRQIDIVRDVLAIQDKPSDVSPSALLTNLLTAIGHPARMPKLAIVLNQFDLVHRAANLDGRVAEILNTGDAVFQDPYALAENQDKLYLPNDGALVDAECRQFLAYAGQQGFVKHAETYQGACQFFAVSAVGGDPRDKAVPEDGISPFRVADPIRWVMYEQWALAGRRRGGR